MGVTPGVTLNFKGAAKMEEQKRNSDEAKTFCNKAGVRIEILLIFWAISSKSGGIIPFFSLKAKDCRNCLNHSPRSVMTGYV